MTDLAFDREFDVTPGLAEAVSPLVRRVLCDNPSAYTFKGTNSYIVGHGRVAIIDPGPLDASHLTALLQAVDGETVTHVVVTHSHADHSPLARELAARTAARTVASGAISGGDDDGPRLDASVDYAFVPDIVLRHGEAITGPGWTLEGVFTPGHMSNHMCFALPEEQTLFSGDHVMAWATSVVAPPDGNMADYFASLKLLLEREDDAYLPGHGPGRRQPKALVRGYLAHRWMREAAILSRIQRGDRTIAAVVAAIYADVDPRLHGAAALSTRAHLEHLIAQGHVREDDGFYLPK